MLTRGLTLMMISFLILVLRLQTITAGTQMVRRQDPGVFMGGAGSLLVIFLTVKLRKEMFRSVS